MCILIWKLTNMQKSFIEIKLKLRGKFQTYETITLADIWLFCLVNSVYVLCFTCSKRLLNYLSFQSIDYERI